METVKALIIDDCKSDRELVKRALASNGRGYAVAEASNREQLESLLARSPYDVVISDYNILGLTGLDVLDCVERYQPEVPVILLTGTGSEEIAVAALKRGAADYVVKTVQHIKKLPSTVTAVLERKVLEKERSSLVATLRFSEDRYRSLVESAHEAILGVADNDTITFFSNGASRMFGYTADEVVGRPATILVSDGHRDAFNRTLAQAKTEACEVPTPRILSSLLRRKAGAEFPTEMSLAPFASASGVGYTAIIRDVSEKRRLEEEVARLDRLVAIGEMVTGIAHEVRNPLSAIATSATLAKNEMADAGLETQSADWIIEGVHRIDGLLKRFFDFAKPLTLELESSDLNSLLQNALDTERFKLNRAGVRVDVVFGAGIPAVVVDPALVTAVFLNVISNAVDAMGKGGTLSVRSAFTRNAAGLGEIRVTFADTGSGIPPEIASRILEPFFTTKNNGVGLGLPLCYKVLKEHGGDFTIVGRDVGTEVSLTLPVGG